MELWTDKKTLRGAAALRKQFYPCSFERNLDRKPLSHSLYFFTPNDKIVLNDPDRILLQPARRESCEKEQHRYLLPDFTVKTGKVAGGPSCQVL
jgi:hypothetical protein